jgi:hypothetical protein
VDDEERAFGSHSSRVWPVAPLDERNATVPQSSAMSPGGEDLAGCNPSAALRADREEDYSAFRKRTSLRRHDSFTLGSFGRSCRPCLRRSVSVRLANGGGFGGWPPYMAASIASTGEFNLMPQGPGRIQAAMREGSRMSPDCAARRRAPAVRCFRG